MEELKAVLHIVGQGGLSVIIFIIWYFTFTRANKENDDVIKHLQEQNEIITQLLKDEQEYKLHLASVLTRLEVKLNTPVQCPLIKEK